MSLPSQQRSFGSRVSGRSRRGRSGGSMKLFGGVVVIAAIIGAVWLAMGGGDGSGPDTNESPDLLPDQAAIEPTPGPAGDDVALVVDEDDGFVETGVLSAARGGESQSPGTATTPAPRTNPTLVARNADRPAERANTADTGSSIEQVQPGSDVAAWMANARAHLNEQNLVEAREALNSALRVPGATERELDLIRGDLSALNAELFFGPKVYEGDRIASTYTIKSGDSLQRITYDLGLACDWRLIQRINKIQNPSRIRVGQKLKVVQGPFHAVVDKSDYRLDMYAGPPGSPDNWVFIRSFDVGLGEDDSTPVGRFVVRPDSKLIDPVWRNPRTGEFFAAEDPENPIGEHWLGLEGTGEIAHVEGYGIHGTIEPESIGMDASMGCIRLVAEDVAVVYEMLEESVSEVFVQP